MSSPSSSSDSALRVSGWSSAIVATPLSRDLVAERLVGHRREAYARSLAAVVK